MDLLKMCKLNGFYTLLMNLHKVCKIAYKFLMNLRTYLIFVIFLH